MKLIQQLQEMLIPFSEADILEAFEEKLEESEFEGIKVDSARIFDEGIEVSFSDEDDSLLSAFFVHDDMDGSSVIVDDIDDDELGGEYPQGMMADDQLSQDDDSELPVIDLDAIDPPLRVVHGITYIDLIDLSWMDDDLLLAILNAGDVDDLETDFEEASAFVIRGGKKVKKALVRRRRRRILTPAQKAGIRKAKIKRKAHQGKTNRKRAKALKIRKRLGLKRNTNKHFKVAGTSDRKR